MQKIKIREACLLGLCLVLVNSAFSQKQTNKRTLSTSPYLNKIYEYVPAPGQFIDYRDYCMDGQSPEDLTSTQVNRLLTEKLAGKAGEYVLSLGGFGGYIVFGLDHPLKKHATGYDFKIYGNAFYKPGYGPGENERVGGNSEPGVVMVSRDENKNALPDDTWYELAGSEYHHAKTQRNYVITYYKPDSLQKAVFWRDNTGREGYIYRNSFHSQPTYFPIWQKTDSLIFKGTLLPDNAINIADSNGPQNWILFAYPWGYADNLPNMEEGSSFKISWAVDEHGDAVSIDSIDFIKVYTGVNQNAGWTGEISTDFAGVEEIVGPVSTQDRKELLEEDAIRVWPNPCKDKIYIENKTSKAKTKTWEKFVLYDLQGRKCASYTLHLGEDRGEISMENYVSGIYFLHYGNRVVKVLKLW
ncbi:MAG: T9SS type A sorting domain-containing protein [Bacteroidales bacterium]